MELPCAAHAGWYDARPGVAYVPIADGLPFA
jgi:hypothetical protein